MPRDSFGIEEAPNDGKAYGRADTDWTPVADEAPIDDKSYTRKNATWVEVGVTSTPTLAVEFVIPNTAPIGSSVLTVEAHGTAFTAATVAMIDGVAVATNYVSPTELNFQIDPAAESVRVASITLQDGTDTTPDNAPFYFTEVTVNYGVGLSLDESAVPPQVNLNPAGNTPAVLGGVYVPLRSAEQGLVVETTTGALVVPLATSALAGAIVEPVDDKLYARGGGATPRWERTVDEAPLDVKQYARSDGGWSEVTSGGVTVSDDPPATPAPNALWWDSDSGAMYLNYTDVDSTQWVHVNPTASGPATVTVGDFAPVSPVVNQLWWNSNDSNMYLWHNDTTSEQWVQVSGDGVAQLPLSGGTMSGGLGFGGATAASATDLSRHLMLYGTTFGFNITSGTMNYVVPDANTHAMYAGTKEVLRVTKGGLETYNDSIISFRPPVNGAWKTALSGDHNNGSPSCDQRWHCGGDNGSGGSWEWWRIGGGYGSAWIMRTTNDPEPGLLVNGNMLGSQLLVRSGAARKQDIRYEQDGFVAAFDALKPARYRLRDQVWPPTFEDGTPVENPERVTRRERFGFIADDMLENPLLACTVETLDGEDAGVDIMQVLALAVAKIKALEANIEALQAKMKIITDLT